MIETSTLTKAERDVVSGMIVEAIARTASTEQDYTIEIHPTAFFWRLLIVHDVATTGVDITVREVCEARYTKDRTELISAKLEELRSKFEVSRIARAEAEFAELEELVE